MPAITLSNVGSRFSSRDSVVESSDVLVDKCVALESVVDIGLLVLLSMLGLRLFLEYAIDGHLWHDECEAHG